MVTRDQVSLEVMNTAKPIVLARAKDSVLLLSKQRAQAEEIFKSLSSLKVSVSRAILWMFTCDTD